jgi:nucleotide-binding universal stress UspA family protein
MNKILVGVDGSASANAAARRARELARALGCELELVHVIPRVVESAGDPLTLGDDWSQRRTERAHSVLFEAERTLASANEEIATTLLEGSPATCLARQAERDDVRMIVVGHRSRTPVLRTVLGSCADKLLQICPKPVMVVPDQKEVV